MANGTQATAPELTPEGVRAITAKMVELLEAKCIRLNGRDPGWRSLFAAVSHRLEECKSHAEFEREVNVVLPRGGLSHVAFFHESAKRAPARYAINATFCECMDEGDQDARWMFQDVHEGGPASRAGIRPGDELLELNGEPLAPPMTPTFALGTDAVLTICRQGEAPKQVTVVLPKPPANGKANAKPPMAEPTSVTASVIEDRIGYVRVAFFPGVNGQRFARELDQALATLSGCDRLIVDLRGNLGGFVGSLRLMSYLTPERLPVGYSLTRKGQVRGWRPDRLPCIDRLPETKLESFWMAVRFLVLYKDRSIRLVTEGLGPKPFHGRVVMLVNEHTLSAGEMVASFAQENGLATLVGTRTGGQVLGGGNFAVGYGFILRMPAAAWFTASGVVVEGQGVTPDIPAPPEGRRLADRDAQLETAVSAVRALE